MIGRLKLFVQESKQEFNRINWPTWRETANLTIIVIVFSIALAAFLGAIDYGFTYFLQTFLL